MSQEERRTGLFEHQLHQLPAITYNGREAQVFTFKPNNGYVKLIIEQYEHVDLWGYIDGNGEFIAEHEERDTYPL